MRPTDVDLLFGCVEFRVPGGKILDRARTKADALRAKVTDRKARIAGLREAHQITDRVLADLLMMARSDPSARSYSVRAPGDAPTTEVEIPAGVLSALQTEQTAIANEEAQIARLAMLLRNLAPDDLHKLTWDDLHYLGF